MSVTSGAPSPAPPCNGVLLALPSLGAQERDGFPKAEGMGSDAAPSSPGTPAQWGQSSSADPPGGTPKSFTLYQGPFTETRLLLPLRTKTTGPGAGGCLLTAILDQFSPL